MVAARPRRWLRLLASVAPPATATNHATHHPTTLCPMCAWLGQAPMYAFLRRGRRYFLPSLAPPPPPPPPPPIIIIQFIVPTPQAPFLLCYQDSATLTCEAQPSPPNHHHHHHEGALATTPTRQCTKDDGESLATWCGPLLVRHGGGGGGGGGG